MSPGTVSKATSLTQDMDVLQLGSEGNLSFGRQCSQLFAGCLCMLGV